ncbi:MAG: hypothetical protein Q7T36_02400 [Fluviicoccus sp.]|nr:hypothetical protein [Fluviicoccus sp.]MDO8329303.1 hypothetical protein [Fluviicoccus sp.]
MATACSPHQARTWPGVKIRTQLWVYRVGGYLLINVIDDPAWLALMFC